MSKRKIHHCCACNYSIFHGDEVFCGHATQVVVTVSWPSVTGGAASPPLRIPSKSLALVRMIGDTSPSCHHKASYFDFPPRGESGGSFTPILAYEVIVGAYFFQKWKIRLDLVAEDFIIDEKALKIILV